MNSITTTASASGPAWVTLPPRPSATYLCIHNVLYGHRLGQVHSFSDSSGCMDYRSQAETSLRTRAIPERFCGGDSLRRGAISSVCTFTLYLLPLQAFGFLLLKLHILLQCNLRQKNFQSAEVGKKALARPIRIRQWLQKCCLSINFRFHQVLDKDPQHSTRTQ